MYIFSGKLKIAAITLMILGLVGIINGFMEVPKSNEQVLEIMHERSHESHAHSSDSDLAGASDHHDQKHLEHVKHQLQNKPWSALYVACIFFFLLTLGVLVFYAIQRAAQAGWSPVLFRVMEGVTSNLLPISIILFVLFLFSAFHFNHLFIWMDDQVVKTDKIIQGKSGYLNVSFFLIRAFVFLLAFNLYRFFSRRLSKKEDQDTTRNSYRKNFKLAAAFLVVFIVFESLLSWDWLMSFDPHWYSTLYAWYVFASFFVSGITMLTVITLYLKSKGHLEFVNSSHIHDLAKFMFAFSIFWTYLWFSQFMLIWYSNIPEEVTYFVTRFQDFKLPFLGLLVLNFIFPFIVLINTDFKRISWLIIIAGIVILFGHYLDFYMMVIPATVGESWSIGFVEIGSLFFFLGLFIYIVFTSLSRKQLVPKNNPLLEESKQFHY